MRLLNVLCLLLLLSGLAAAQATIIGGSASSWMPAYGPYGVSYVPLVTTPSVTLSATANSSVGASSSAFGMVAGATNSTLSISTQAPEGVYTTPVFYPSTQAQLGGWAPATTEHEPHHGKGSGPSFDFAISNEGQGIASVVAGLGQVRKASRTYTNTDVDQVNQTNGTVKYGGKTEHI